MNCFAILEKSDIKIAVNLNKETSEDELNALKLEGYKVILEQVEAESSSDALQRAKQLKKTKATAQIEYQSKYKTGLLVGKIIAVIGWLMMIVGIENMLAGSVRTMDQYIWSYGIMFSAMLPGFGIFLSGLFSVAASQVIKATVDNADNTHRIYLHLKGE
ncbi:hypothetical protein VII00023_08884 [Vibrio ichthyoenteri ATCC 700023]|uniref:Uncharacterized protein n=1 Tax=Vibrio ichthyoenteri ATCC 700023 TaxID=870968 RepID=F9S576_9VIBR|nr:hypothetical protein [Vibrio ichthyoenteri]EGU35942.1 hypothetical protein VII00023_08884 [Vibrio ichthyoenteri ATCC 700023]